MTISKWTIYEFLNFFFMKNNIEKHLSCSMLHKTIAIEKFTKLYHFNSLWQMIWLTTRNVHILKHGLQSKGPFIATIKLTIISFF
jgi:hypothetical protein